VIIVTANATVRTKLKPTHSIAAGGRRPRTAFVLSGGASLGALQVGMLRALYERRIVPDLLVGTSAGALNAAFIASRPQTVATADDLAGVWRHLRREEIFPFSLRAVLVGLSGRRDHLVPDRGLRRLVGRHVEFADIGDADIPLHVVTFDLSERREVLLSGGPTVDVITAAASIPGVFPPVCMGDCSLVDGGVVNNTPISHAVALGAERIFVLPTRDPRQTPTSTSRGALGAALDGVGLLTDGRLQFDLARYSRDAELIVLPAPNTLDVQPTNFEHSSRLMRDALAATRAFLTRGDRHYSPVSGSRHRRRARRSPGAVSEDPIAA
jgi:NTE family protein